MQGVAERIHPGLAAHRPHITAIQHVFARLRHNGNTIPGPATRNRAAGRVALQRVIREQLVVVDRALLAYRSRKKPAVDVVEMVLRRVAAVLHRRDLPARLPLSLIKQRVLQAERLSVVKQKLVDLRPQRGVLADHDVQRFAGRMLVVAIRLPVAADLQAGEHGRQQIFHCRRAGRQQSAGVLNMLAAEHV